MKFVFAGIHILLLTALAFLSVTLFYDGLSGAPVPPPPVVKRSGPLPDEKKASPQEAPPREHLSVISKRNLFKVALEKASSPVPEKKISAVETLEETRLDLQLLGTIILEAGESFAVIQEGRKKKQERYRSGDNIQGAQIKDILREKVVLHYKNKDEVLIMAAAKGADDPSPKASPPVRRSKSSTGKVTLSRTDVDDALGNISKLMGDARLRPHFSKGKPDGLLIYGIKRDSLFQAMGLKNGDILTGVDGSEIKSVDDALAFYENLKDETDVAVQIKRRGRSKEIQYHVE